jgi:hypothetical protein
VSAGGRDGLAGDVLSTTIYDSRCIDESTVDDGLTHARTLPYTRYSHPLETSLTILRSFPRGCHEIASAAKRLVILSEMSLRGK